MTPPASALLLRCSTSRARRMHWLMTVVLRERDLDLARRLHPDMKDLRKWVSEYLKLPPQLPQFHVQINFETTTDVSSEGGESTHSLRTSCN